MSQYSFMLIFWKSYFHKIHSVNQINDQNQTNKNISDEPWSAVGNRHPRRGEQWHENNKSTKENMPFAS